MAFSEELLECCINYLTGDKSVLSKQSKLCQEFALGWLNDKSSRTLHEAVSLKLLGYEKLDKKHGADGLDTKTNLLIECKPQFAYTDNKGKPKKLRGGGTFNDITFEKIKLIENWKILCSGFSDEGLVFLLEFPMNVIVPILEKKLNKKANNPKTRKSVGISYTDYIHSDTIIVHYLDKKIAPKYMSNTFYKKILEKLND